MRILITTLLASAILLASGCSTREPVDLILTNGKILTVDPNSTIADTLVVRGESILAVGTADLLERYQADRTVDLEGRTVLPGFIDSHIHIRGNARRFITLNGTSSIQELQRKVAVRSALLGEGEWITGYGWSEDEFSEQRKPTRSDLDAIAPRNPILLTRAGGHSAVANSLALQLAGITAATPDPEGGVIERDGQGEATGVIRERQGIVGDLVPEASEEELRESLLVNLTDLLRLGITSIIDASKQLDDYRRWEEVYREHRGQLPRAALQLHWTTPAGMAEFRQRVGEGDHHLKPAAIKVFADGGFTGPAAYTLEPYLDQGDYRGYLNMPEEQLQALLSEVHGAGWQLGVHAIGDAAIVLIVDMLSDLLEKQPRENHRHYLNHFSMRPPDDTMRKMASHDIAITQQPNFTYTLEGRYSANLDGWRLQHNNPLRAPMDQGVFVGISSDVLPIGPLTGLYAAVTRKGMSGAVYGADEQITIEEAIRGYTINGAYFSFDEDIKGSLEPGKLADFIVLSDDITSIDPDRIPDIQVLQTYLGGNLVYEHQRHE